MTPTAQLIAELREHVEFAYVPARLRDAMERAAEALARQEELLAEAGKVVEPFRRMGDLVSRYDEFRGRVSTTEFAQHFRAAARLSDKLKG